TSAQAKQVYEVVLALSGVQRGFLSQVSELWSELTIEDASRASNLEEARKVVENAPPWNNRAREEALTELINQCRTLEELKIELCCWKCSFEVKSRIAY